MLCDKFSVQLKRLTKQIYSLRRFSTVAEEFAVEETKLFKKYKQSFRKRTMPIFWNSENLYVSVTKDKKSLILNFVYELPNDKEPKNQLTTSFRDLDSNLSSTYERLSIKLNDRLLPKKGKKKKSSPATAIQSDQENSMDLLTLDSFMTKSQTGEILDPNTVQNSTAFLTLGHTFHIGDRVYRIVSTVPYLDKFKIDQRLLVGFPVIPSVSVIDGCPKLSSFYWFVENNPNSDFDTKKNFKGKKNVQPSYSSLLSSDIDSSLAIDGFTLKSTNFFYIPTVEDAGRRISLICVPRSEKSPGSPVTFTPNATVENLDEHWIWTESHELCAQRAPNDVLRVVDYNVLANLYLDLDPKLKQNELFYFYCPLEFQQYTYRYPLLMKEILGYNGDLLCLQEVETKFWMRYLEPYLTQHGYGGVFAKKGCEVNEGSATFYRRDKLELIESSDVLISKLIKENNALGYEDLATTVQQDETTSKIFLSRASILQVSLFRCLTAQSTLAVVCNTHLHYKPHDGHIRLLQAAICLRYLKNYVENLKLQFKNEKIGIIFCGDFNSTPDTSVYKMMTSGRLSADDEAWLAGSTKENRFKGIDFQVPFALRSAFSPVDYVYTNYVLYNGANKGVEEAENFDDLEEKLNNLKPFSKDSATVSKNSERVLNDSEVEEKCFQGVLDYIFISDDVFDVRQTVPMPRDDLVKKFKALPSKICPSDHLPLICELNFK